MTSWTPDDMPDLKGRVAVVTGASSGIGAEAAAALAAKGARVVLAVRDQAKGDTTAASILARHSRAQVSVSVIDMADLASVRDFAGRAAIELPQVDILLNNAGLGMQPARATTADGFERQFGTNHLGHFALTGLVLPLLLRAPAPRVVAISSFAHRSASIDFDDLQGERLYGGIKAYGQSKLANLMFALELDRRSRLHQTGLISVAAHPGVSNTGFMAATGRSRSFQVFGSIMARLLGQDAAHGAWSALYAATMPNVQGGQYWGPDGIMEIRGTPTLVKIYPQARDQSTLARLWDVSETLTGVTYGVLDQPLAA
jgi:NAD(P)-dependent dehydrogenase (short-subunit alcohol dehydrogenase family)